MADQKNRSDRHVSRRETRITQFIKFDVTSYGALSELKQALQRQDDAKYSNSVVCRAMALEFRELLNDNPHLIHRLSDKAAHCASKRKNKADPRRL